MIDDADGSVPVAGGSQRGRTARRVLAILRSRSVRISFLLAMVGVLVFTLVDQGPTFWHDLRKLPLWVVTLALVANIASYVGSMLVWRASLKILGSALTVPQAWRIFFIGQLGKYLPGSVWPVIAQVELSASEGVPRVRGALSIGLSVGVMLSTGAIVSGLALPFFLSGSPVEWTVAGLVAVAGAVLFAPRVMSWLINLGLRLARQPALARSIAPGDAIEAASAAMLGWIAAGLMTYLLARQIAGNGGDLLITSIAAYSIAWVAGYLFVVAPAGAGVREAAMVGVLSSHVAAGAALTVALVSRALSVISDVSTAAVAAALVGRRKMRGVRARTHVPERTRRE